MPTVDDGLVRSLLHQQFYEPIDQIIDRYHLVRIPIPGSGAIIERMAEFFDLTISFIDHFRVLSTNTMAFLSRHLKVDEITIKRSLAQRMTMVLEQEHQHDNVKEFAAFLLLCGLIEAIQQAKSRLVNQELLDELNWTTELAPDRMNEFVSRLPSRWHSEYSILVNLKVLEHYSQLTNQQIKTIPFDLYKSRVIFALKRLK